MKKIITNFYMQLKFNYTKYKISKRNPYILIDFDSVNYCIYIKARVKYMVFKISIDNILNDHGTLSSLSPNDSGLIGYFVGKYIKEPQMKSSDFIIRNNHKDKFLIKYETRDRSVCLLDTTNEKEFLVKPETLLRNKRQLSMLGSQQAFYIGILAGRNAFIRSRRLTRPKSNTFKIINLYSA